MSEREAPGEDASDRSVEPSEEPAPDAAPHEAEEAATRNPLDERGLERPRFLLDFPQDPELDRLIAAFEAGNYAYVRKHAERVAKEATTEPVREAARELRRRIEPDPLVAYLLGLSLLLLVFLVLWAYLGHDH